MTIEKKIESVQEYNLLKLLKANSSLKRFGVEWIKLDHNLCRAFTTNGYAIIVANPRYFLKSRFCYETALIPLDKPHKSCYNTCRLKNRR